MMKSSSWSAFKLGLFACPFFFLLYLVRFKIGPIPTNILELYTAIMAIWYAAGVLFLNYPKPTLGRLPTAIAIGLFLLSATITTITTFVSLPPEHTLVPLGIWKGWFMAPAILYLLLTTTFKTEEETKKLLDIFIGALSTQAMLMLVQYFTGIFPGPLTTADFRLVWPYLDPWTFEGASANYPALFLSPALLLSLGLVMKRGQQSPLVNGLFYGLSTLVLATAIYLTKSFGAYLAIIGAIGLIIFLSTKNSKRWLAFPIGLIALVIAAGTQWHTEKFQWFLKLGRDPATQIESSTSERVNIYAVSLSMLKTHPVRGIGMGQYQRQFEKTAPEVLGRVVTRQEINHALHPHNTYVMFWLSGGVLLLVTGITVVTVWMRGLPSSIKWLLWAPMIYWLLHGVVDVFYWKNDLAFSFWFLGALMVIAKSPTSITGTVIEGIKKGRELGFPTANLKVDAPPNLSYGVYLVSLHISGQNERGLLYYGPRQTAGLPETIVCEVTVLDFEGDLYGQKLKLRVHQKLREQMAFASETELKEQIQKDVLAGRNLKI